MILGIFRVSGHSMLPNYSPGQKVIVSKVPYIFSNPKKGDVIVFKISRQVFIKRIKEIRNNKFHVVGDNLHDSLNQEPVTKKQLLGKVLIKIK